MCKWKWIAPVVLAGLLATGGAARGQPDPDPAPLSPALAEKLSTIRALAAARGGFEVGNAGGECELTRKVRQLAADLTDRERTGRGGIGGGVEVGNGRLAAEPGTPTLQPFAILDVRPWVSAEVRGHPDDPCTKAYGPEWKEVSEKRTETRTGNGSGGIGLDFKVVDIKADAGGGKTTTVERTEKWCEKLPADKVCRDKPATEKATADKSKSEKASSEKSAGSNAGNREKAGGEKNGKENGGKR